MLSQIDLSKSLPRDQYKWEKKELSLRLAALQRQLIVDGIPVVIVLEGWDGVGKGSLINSLIYNLDARSYRVIGKDLTGVEDFLILRKYWKNMPSPGNITLFDRSWNSKAIDEFILGEKADLHKLNRHLKSVKEFEKQIIDSGVCLIKVFFHMDSLSIEARFEEWLAEKERKHYVSKLDLKRHEHYDAYFSLYDRIIKQDYVSGNQWHLIPALDFNYAVIQFGEVLEKRLQVAINLKRNKPILSKSLSGKQNSFSGQTSLLSEMDLNHSLSKEDYKLALKERQRNLLLLEAKIRELGIPVVLLFEGWDAAGKGGAIKRLIKKLDPRGYQVIPVAAPNAVENLYHYLWRFWIKMPHEGQIKIFDRSWYGRLMVERVEGFCSDLEWQRAFREINQLESYLVNSGVHVLKFWIQIDKEEQLRRFEARKMDPEKQWKITDEDWRNRDKWDDYEIAVNDMLSLCNQTQASWNLIEGNCKYFARVKVLDEILKHFEKLLNV